MVDAGFLPNHERLEEEQQGQKKKKKRKKKGGQYYIDRLIKMLMLNAGVRTRHE